MVANDALRAAAVRGFDRRIAPSEHLASYADEVARACHDMAGRFLTGGKLLVFGNGGPATDAQHIAVEFVHPVIVGKRALPALSLVGDVATVTVRRSIGSRPARHRAGHRHRRV
ncbi:MAG: SIS domain-containing protein, partial [Mycobacteriales bacterium]